MSTHRGVLFAAGLMLFSANVSAQSPLLTPTQVAPFLGTWLIAMTNPAGAQETVRMVNINGTVTASVQLGKFPPSDVTAMLKDGNMLVLTTMRRENGVPIRVVISLIVDGQTMNLAEMLENSQTIKRGSGKKQE